MGLDVINESAESDGITAIDPKNKRVEIYRADQAVEVLEHPSTLSGEDVLPGFTLTLKRIWT